MYDASTKEYAAELYIISGRSLQQISAELGCTQETVGRWAQEFDWKKQRQAYRRLSASIKHKQFMLMEQLLDKALKSNDPQHVYAYSALAKVAFSTENKNKFSLETYTQFFTDLITYLQEKDTEALTALSRNFEGFSDHAKGKYGLA